jgi:hypothetical protein
LRQYRKAERGSTTREVVLGGTRLPLYGREHLISPYFIDDGSAAIFPETCGAARRDSHFTRFQASDVTYRVFACAQTTPDSLHCRTMGYAAPPPRILRRMANWYRPGDARISRAAIRATRPTGMNSCPFSTPRKMIVAAASGLR